MHAIRRGCKGVGEEEDALQLNGNLELESVSRKIKRTEREEIKTHSDSIASFKEQLHFFFLLKAIVDRLLLIANSPATPFASVAAATAVTAIKPIVPRSTCRAAS